MPDANAARHAAEIAETVGAWKRKPALRAAYGDFYARMAAWIRPEIGGLTVELGSGQGQIRQFLTDVVTTDLEARPGVDRAEDAYAPSFATGEVGHLLLLDVWHHLQFPGSALSAWARIVRAGGRAILLEPAAGLLGRIIFGLFHHEPLALEKPITWEPASGVTPPAQGYYAAQGNAWRIFRRGEGAARIRELGWDIRAVRPFPALAWLAAGGFRGPALWPSRWSGALRPIETTLTAVPTLTATRLLVVLERSAAPPGSVVTNPPLAGRAGEPPAPAPRSEQ